MDGHKSDDIATNHKRRSPEWSQQHNETEEDAFEQVCLQTPHTLRLLKLIEEGTLSHARMAASHLASLLASPIVLWDLLGRLQAFLRSPEWSTRVHASLAMQGVAQHIPPTDQCDFLKSTFSGELWLTIDDIAQGLETVLTEGHVLLAACETDDSFETQEERLKRLDESRGELEQNFVEERVKLQREILAQRLGLGGVVRAVGGTFLSDVITKEDLLMNDEDASARQAQNRERTKRKRHINDEESSSIRALLVLEMQRQQEQTGTGGARSHKNPQTLLATELIFRMFDPSWHVRHGALLGILSLLRAWKRLVGKQSFGMWPHDILARCICVLSLDRFGDYAGTSIGQKGNGGDGVVAPVREIAAQVLSVLWMMAPRFIQDECLGVLVQMTSSDEWEVRHGALLALKYIVVMLLTYVLDRTERSSMDTTVQVVTQVAQARLLDKMADVQSVAAQILMNILNDTREGEPQRAELIRASCQSLWDALGGLQSFSSCAVDFVSLFSAVICADCSLVCQSLGSRADQGPTTFGAIAERLLEFIDFDSPSVKLEALKAIAAIAGPYAAMITESEKQNTTVVLVYICLVERIFDSVIAGAQTFAILEDDEESRSRAESLCRVQDVAWAKLVGSACPVLQSFPSHRNNLLVRLVLSFFKIQHNGIGQGVSGLNMRAAGALARLLVELDFTDDRGTHAERMSFLETMFGLLLYSPWTKHYESACILYQAMCSSSHSSQGICRDLLHQLLMETPLCLTMSCLYSNLSKPTVIESCERAIGIALGRTLEKPGECEVEQVWNQALTPWGLAFPRREQESTPAAVSITSMRVNSLIAGAIVSGGKAHLPSKLTALVRALMTSLKSERAPERLTITSESLALLLKTLSDGDDESHVRVKTKVMENICVMLASESLSSLFRVDDSIPTGATQVLTLFVSQLPPNETLERIAPIWDRLKMLAQTDVSALDDESMVESLPLLAVICKTLRRGTAVTRHLIEKLTQPLVRILCTCPYSSIRTVVIESVVSLCKTDPELALDTSLPLILNLLADNHSDPRRYGALCLLKSIVEEIGMDICPFVRCLLPIIMALMTDSLEDCAKQAAQIFACLVRVSPLVRQTVRRRWERNSTDDHSGRVIDHLIHGKPLPPCVLPTPIVEELTSAGVSLRAYQMEGITWLRFLQQVKLNGALCDDMGLGKTLQALVAVALSHHHAICTDASAKLVSLVICPSTLVGHWLAEIRKFFPLQNVLRGVSFGGSPKQKFGVEMGEQYNIVVTSYSVLRREVKILSQRQWHHCILDEGHLMKNPKTVTAKSARRIRARHKLILTGTPVQNRVHELWAAFDFLMPNFLGSQTWFSKNFARPIGNGQLPGASAESISSGMEKLKLLHQQVLPFILRREKEQVLRELPPKCITDIPCTLSREQQDLYETFCRGVEARSAFSALQKSIAVSGNAGEVENDNSAASSTLGDDALRSLLYLRLLCTHPSLVQANRRRGSGSDDSSAHLDSSGKLTVLNELLRSAHICDDELTAADNDASVLYCDFDEKQGGDEVSSLLCSYGDTSCGGNALATIGQVNTPKGTKCLIFAQFTQSLDVVEHVLFQPHMPSLRYLRLDGAVPPERRGEIVETFNRDDSIKVMLLTTRVGGLGLNLTGASTVIFLEHDYNPHADLQAMDRVHRIGQTKAVNVYRLITQNTIEEKIMKLQETKMAMSKAIVNAENSTMYSMGTDRLLDIFTFRSNDNNKRSGGELTSNLGALDETYSADDYASLSVQEFISGFHGLSES